VTRSLDAAVREAELLLKVPGHAALRLLEADGLAELFTGVGWYVKKPPAGAEGS